MGLESEQSTSQTFQSVNELYHNSQVSFMLFSTWNKAAFAPARGTIVQSNSFVQLYGWVVVKTCLEAEAYEQPNDYWFSK